MAKSPWLVLVFAACSSGSDVVDDVRELEGATRPMPSKTHVLSPAEAPPAPPTEPAPDPGTCSTATDCESGLCYDGVCADATAGHVYVIGSSFGNTPRAFDRILGGALFSSQRDLDLVVFHGDAPAAVVASTNAAISRAATLSQGAVHTTIASTSPALATLLPSAHALVIYAQPQASDEQLRFLGDEWSLPLDDFARRGGTIIVLDTASDNGGTAQVLAASGLLTASDRATSVGTLAYVNAPEDIAVARAPLTFAVGETSVGWATSSGTNVVLSETGHAVVIHRAIY